MFKHHLSVLVIAILVINVHSWVVFPLSSQPVQNVQPTVGYRPATVAATARPEVLKTGGVVNSATRTEQSVTAPSNGSAKEPSRDLLPPKVDVKV